MGFTMELTNGSLNVIKSVSNLYGGCPCTG